MSYKITAYRANGTSRDYADVFDEDAARLLAFWERGLRLPPVRIDLGQKQTRSVLINADKFEAIEVEATPLQLFANTHITGSAVSIPYCQATPAGGLTDPGEA